MIRIGFADYYLGEWHADNYPGWMREICAEMGDEIELAYAWAEDDVSPRNGMTTDEWCEKNHFTRCATLEELCEKSDAIVILAPSDPDKHLPYASVALTYGKPTYIDKTFAPDLETAQKIFDIAAAHRTPMFSTSALRCSEELGKHADGDAFILTGGGSNLGEYIIHLVEMTVVLLSDPVKRVKATAQGGEWFFAVESASGKKATLIYAPAMPYTVTSENADGKSVYTAIKSPFFRHLMKDVLVFAKSGALPFESAQTLEAMRMRDAILRSTETPGEWVEI